MQYHIFLLKFLTPVHFGNTANGGALDKVAINCSADTLFAALCNEAAAQEAEPVEALVQKLEAGELVLSSLLPYWKTDEDFQFYLPKPLMKPADEQRQLPQSYAEVKRLRSQIKKQKNLHMYGPPKCRHCCRVAGSWRRMNLLCRWWQAEWGCATSSHDRIMSVAVYLVHKQVCTLCAACRMRQILTCCVIYW